MTSGFVPSTANRVAQPTGTSYTDTGLAAGTYFYKVTAEDAAGNVGSASNQASATVTTDSTRPTVSITAPAASATVAGLTAFTANAADNVAVAGVQFRVDGVNLGAEDLTAPYAIDWDTRGELNGPHTLTAVARDTSGNVRTSTLGDSHRRQRGCLTDRPSSGVRPRSDVGHARVRLVRQQPHRHRRGHDVGRRPLRRCRFARRRERPNRCARTRHLLQQRLHLRGVGPQVDGQERRRPPRHVERSAEAGR